MDGGPQETECAVTVDSRFRGNDVVRWEAFKTDRNGVSSR